jgi:hypothetical protein
MRRLAAVARAEATRVSPRFRVALRDSRPGGATGSAAGRALAADALGEDSRTEDVRDDVDSSKPNLASTGRASLAASATSPSALDARADRRLFLLTARLRF